MSNYPLKVNKYNWRSLEPQTNLCYTEDYIADHYDLYLTSEYIPDDYGNTRRYYRLHANRAHSIEMALAYDVKCPCCGKDVTGGVLVENYLKARENRWKNSGTR